MLPPVPVMLDNEWYAEIIHLPGLVNVLRGKKSKLDNVSQIWMDSPVTVNVKSSALNYSVA